MVAEIQNYPHSGKNKKLIKKFLKQFADVTKDPHEYLSVQPKRADTIKDILKDLYIWTVKKDENKHPDVLPGLVLHGMDEEQIWQQMEIYNECTCPTFIDQTSKLLSAKDNKFDVNLSTNIDEGCEENDEDEREEELPEDEDFSGESELDSEDEEVEIGSKKLKKEHRKTIVDDKFFKLGEMEEFLKLEDERERQKQNKKGGNEDGIDYFNDDFSDEEEENVNYRDFFENVDDEEVEQNDDHENNEDSTEESLLEEEYNTNDEKDIEDEADSEGDLPREENTALYSGKVIEGKPGFESDEDSEDDAGENQVKSSFEIRQERLKQRIEEYEDEALAEKPWQLKGEITATSRPQNSLLQEVLEFDATARPAPVITEETTMRLEDIIKQRIRNKAWDDVEKKVKTITTPQEYRKKLILDQEKSKESLAQIYEKEYQKELDKLDPNREEREEEPKKHTEIKTMMRSLFIKLDALSNFHYTPKPVAPEPKIITNTPAVNMEEVAPVAISNAKMLAPEEIKNRAKADVLGKSERSRTDKNRERRKKKAKQRAIYKAKEERDLEKQKLGIKLSSKEEKSKMLRNVMKSKNVEKLNKSNEGSFKSSKTFFTQLQEKAAIKRSKQAKRLEADGISAKKLKL